ncbi:unnamed protein product, partial [Didymodactylos carnosus]
EGQRAKFDCFVNGEPSPTIRWLKDGLPLDVERDKYKYQAQLQTNGKVTLVINDCTQDDAGSITIIAENRAGSTNCSAELTVEPHDDAARLKRRVSFDVPDLVDKRDPNKPGIIPQPPSQLLLTPHSKSSLLLSWEHSPSYSRQSPLTYIVEVRDPRTYSWTCYAQGLPDTSIYIRGLNLNLIYAFRVRAENAYGVSDPSPPVTSRLLTKSDVPRIEDEIPAKKRKPETSYDDIGGSRPSIQTDGPDVQYFIEGQKTRIAILLLG